MNHLKVASLFFLIFLAGCVEYSTELLQPAKWRSTETSTSPLQTETVATLDPSEVTNEAPLGNPTPEITSEVAKKHYQLQSNGLLPEFVEDLDIVGNLTYYELDVSVTLDPSRVKASIDGMARITYTHSSDIPLNELVLMLWPNDPQYSADMTAGPVEIDGRLVEFTTELDGLVLRASLLQELQSGESLEVSLPFHLEIQGSIRDQRKRFGITNGVLMAPTFYPLIPRFVDGKWQAEKAPEGGDTTSSDMAYYQVSITAPEAFEIIASGVAIERKLHRDNEQTVTYVTGPMRDFAFAVGSFEKISRNVNDVLLNVWILSDHNTSGERILNAAAMQMEFLHDLVGPYPYAEIDILDTPCAFGGIEYPSLIYICSVGRSYVIDTTVHEVAHQWFYGLIGNDQVHEPWLDEAAASYWQVLYHENATSEDRATSQLNQYRSWISGPETRDAPIGLGIGDYGSSGDYYTIVYYKGALFYDALRSRLGDEVFFEFLKTYYQRYRYEFVSSQDFQETAEDVCDCDLDEFFDLWVYQGGEIPD